MEQIENYTNKIFNMNCLELLNHIPAESVDLTVTSPPYDDIRLYEDTLEWNFEVFKEVASQLFRVTKIGGVVVWVVGDRIKDGNKSLTSFKQALYFQELGFNVYDVIIYEKSGASPPVPKRYSNCFEYMFVFSKGKPKTVNLLTDKKNSCAGNGGFGKHSIREKDGTLTPKNKIIVNNYGVRTNIWKYTNTYGFSTADKTAYEHPAIFPERLALDHILSWSNENDVVLDPFGGSGTTAKMCQLNNRKWIYCDKVPKYCEIAKSRIFQKEMCVTEQTDDATTDKALLW